MKLKAKKSVRTNKSSILSKDQLVNMMSATYQPNSMLRAIDEYVPDPTISDNRVKVYHNVRLNHTVVAHRGSQTLSDWVENAAYSIGIKKGSNWSHSKKKQKEAENKYGIKNLTTIGHSKGALHAQEFGEHGDIVTSNKPVNIPDLFRKVPSNQLDYVGEGDVVSMLRPWQRGADPVVLSKGKTTWQRVKAAIRPVTAVLKEHKIDTILRKEKNSHISNL